jgi:hypothetical protein
MQFLFYKILFIFLLVACQQEASISLSEVELNNYNQSNNSNQNNSNPTIVSLIAPSDGSYKENDELIFTIDISESVTITGTSSYVAFNLGGNARQAICSAGTVTSATCSYTIQAGENDSDGIEYSSPLLLSGSTIVDADGNNLDLNFTVTSAAGVLVDTSAPTSPSIAINASEFTASTSVTLNLSAVEASQMYVTNTASCSGGGSWEDIGATKAWTLGQTNGVATVYVKFRDQAGNESSCIDDSITHDSTTPTSTSIAINASEYTTSTSATLTLAATGAHEMYITNTPGCSADGSWMSYATSKSWTLAQTNALATVYVKFRNVVGSESACISDTITHDTIAPTLTSIAINASEYAISSFVTLNLSATGASEMYITESSGCSSGGTWESYSTSKGLMLNQLNTLATVYVKYRDGAGNESACISDTITHDNIAPNSTSISIAAAATYTTTTSITLTLAASGASEMYITNTATCSAGGTWESYSTSKTWTLGQTNATATVYVKFRDEAGNESACLSDSISHDSTAPSSTTLAINASEYTTSTSVTLNLSATGASEMYITNTAACSADGSWESYSTSKAWTLGQTNSLATVYVKFRDLAGNESSCISDTITHDTIAPTSTSIAINASEYTNSTSATLNLAATGASQMYVTNTASCSSGGTWESYSTSKAWTLGQTNGVASVYVKFRDQTGNESSCIDDSITHDGIAPTITLVSVPSDGSYKQNDQLSFSVDFSETVTITGTTSYIALSIGGTPRQAICQAGSGTNTTCSYTIQAGENDSDGIAYTSPVILSTSSMRDVAGNNLVLTFTEVSTENILVDNTAPTIISVTPPSNGSYILGGSIDYVVEYSEPVTVTNVPRLVIDVGGVTRYADLRDGNRTKYLTFSYLIAEGDLDLNGITNNINIDLNGATLRDVAGNTAAILIGAQSTSGVILDGVLPTLAITSPVNNSYINAITYSTTFAISGTCSENGRTVTIKINGSNADGASGFNCNGTSFSGTVNITGLLDGSHKITASISDSAGNSVETNFISVSIDTSAPSTSSFVINDNDASTNSTSVHLKLSATDAAQMYVTNTVGCSSGGSWESYATGKSWTLGQTNGVATVYVKYRDEAGNETACLSDTITHLDSIPTSTTIAINSSEYTNTTSATLNLSASGATQMYITNTAGCGSGGTWESYATSKAWTLGQTNATATVYVKYRNASLTESSCINDTIIHDNTAPTISSIVMPVNKNYNTGQTLDFTVNFSESVTITNTPRIAITLTSGTVYANYFTGSNSANIVFRYTVESSHADANGINLVSPLDLNGGTIRDLASNNATLTFSPPTNTILINYNLARLVWLDESSNIILAYDFGQPGVVTTKQFYLKNNKTSSTSALTTSFTLPSTFFSYVTNNCNTVSLAAGATCSIQIRFDPTVAGEDGTKLAVANATGNIFDPTQIAPLALTGTK